MTADRVSRWLDELSSALDAGAALVARGREAFDTDPAVPQAFEALCVRAGELSKRLTPADPDRFDVPVWSQAARNREVVVHHDDRVDQELLWATIAQRFVELRMRLDRAGR